MLWLDRRWLEWICYCSTWPCVCGEENISYPFAQHVYCIQHVFCPRHRSFGARLHEENVEFTWIYDELWRTQGKQYNQFCVALSDWPKPTHSINRRIRISSLCSFSLGRNDMAECIKHGTWNKALLVGALVCVPGRILRPYPYGMWCCFFICHIEWVEDELFFGVTINLRRREKQNWRNNMLMKCTFCFVQQRYTFLIYSILWASFFSRMK